MENHVEFFEQVMPVHDSNQGSENENNGNDKTGNGRAKKYFMLLVVFVVCCMSRQPNHNGSENKSPNLQLSGQSRHGSFVHHFKLVVRMYMEMGQENE